MTRLTPAEYDAFARDLGRPPEDFETMYRQPSPEPHPFDQLRGLTIRKDPPAFEAVSTPGDAINPSHYKVGGIETIDYMRAKSTPEEFEGYLRLSAIKYLSRVGHKHGDHDAARAEEYRKALWFIERLVQECER
jgi:hypothetical protein